MRMKVIWVLFVVVVLLLANQVAAMNSPLNRGIPAANVSQIHPTETIDAIMGGTGVGNISREEIQESASPRVHEEDLLTNTTPATAITDISLSPAPYFPTGPDHGIHIQVSYTSTGLIYSYLIGKDVTNGGGAGNVFYTISGDYFSLKSKTFSMESGETVTVWAEICNGIVSYIPSQNVYSSVRASQAGDTDVGSFTITPPPNWGFNGTPTSGTVPLTVKFTDTSAGSWTSWSWDFGDGGHSSLQNPSHIYTSAGTYNVILNAAIPYNTSKTFTRNNYITVTGVSGNSITKIGVTNGQQWYLDNNGNGAWDTGTDSAFNFGSPGGTAIVGDWSGTGTTKIGVYRDGVWYLDNDGSGTWNTGDKEYSFGASGWTPLRGNWSGTSTNIGVTNGQQWYLDSNGNGSWDTGVDYAYSFGAPGWTPVVGDWNGDGTAKIGVTNGQQWYLDTNGNGVWDQGTDMAYNFGAVGWTPMVGDWNGDNKTEIGVTNGQQWYLDSNGNGAWDKSIDHAYSFGATGWTPVVGDWNGDNKTKIGVTNGQQWYLDTNGNGVWDAGTDKAYSFGAYGWTPIVGRWS